jgi:serine/threonine protein kinase
MRALKPCSRAPIGGPVTAAIASATIETAPLDVAEAILLALAEGRAAAISVEPNAEGWRVAIEEPVRRDACWLPGLAGEAVVARLGALAGIDLAAIDGRELHTGRLRARHGGRTVELLVLLQAQAGGLMAEVRLRSRPEAPAHESRLAAYRIGSELGRGGMGVVYRGEHRALGRPVAIKVMYADHAHNAAAVARFRLEARAASAARHVAVVDVFDFGRIVDGRPFMVMELVEGQSLAQALEVGPLAVRRAVTIARRLARALEAVHRAGVVHCDIKPANVILAERDRPHLIDFGAAQVRLPDGRLVGEPDDGMVLGTPYYMSPEQARGAPLDGRSDVYQIGCVLFEMLTGHVPFDGDCAVDVLLAHIDAAIPPVVGPDGPVPELVATVVRRAMAKGAAARFPTAGALATALEDAAVQLGGDRS